MSKVFIVLILHGAIFANEVAPTIQSQQQLVSLYDSLTHPILDDQQVAAITDVSFERGGQRVLFVSGTIRFFAPVNGKVFGAVFLGSGSYIISPPTEVERLEFERQTNNRLDSGRFAYRFQRAVLWFADSVFREIKPFCQFRAAGVQRPERDAVVRSIQYATDPSNDNVIIRILQELFEPHPARCLLAHFLLDREGNDFFLDCDDRRFEEVRVSQPAAGYSGGFSFARQPICSFHLPEEYEGSTEDDLSQEDKRPITILDTKIDITVEAREKMILTVAVHFRPTGDPPSSVTFYLDPYFELKSVKNNSGEDVPFLRDKEAWEFLVALPKQDSPEYVVSFQYDAEFKLFGWIADIFPPDLWYPVNAFLERSNFDMTYRIPPELTVVSAGWKVSESIDADRKIVHYKTKEPTLLVSFSMGEYNTDSIREFAEEPSVKGYYFGNGDVKPGLHDMAKSIHLFSNLFGKIPYDEFNAVDGPFGNGQSFQQLLHLPATKENVKAGVFSVTIGRAHEIAHAWWGHAVGWRSYHDQWLSEGFAHYSALLHALYVLRQDQPFFEKLKEWREAITGVRKYAFGDGPAAGSIWLGYRTGSVRTREDPGLLIYEKGAWVLHMLRMLMMDLQTLKEDKFKAMIKDFCVSFTDLNPGTIDFQHTVEKYMRVDMSWFFKEWVYRSEIPTYTVHHTFSQNAEGKWTVNISVKQSGVPAGFKMFVPIEIKLNDGNSAFSRLFIDQPTKDFTYELDTQPSQFVFNKFESVLCKVNE